MNSKFKKIVAWVAIVLLVSLYLTALILALCGASITNNFFILCLYLTLAVPIVAFVLIWLSDKKKNKRSIGDSYKDFPDEENKGAL